MVDALRDAGCRITPQRLVIIDHIVGRSDHPGARQIHRELHAGGQRLSLATVYNTLRALVGQGLLQELEFDAADNRYDTNLAAHVNLVCTACGRIEDLERQLPVATTEVLALTGFETDTVRIQYRGVCGACRGTRGPARNPARGENCEEV